MPAADELVGQQLGNYELEALVGRGAMAKVYRALEHPLERTVAVKVMAPSMQDDPTFARRFLQEARAIGALHHPNILTIYHYGEWQGRPYIVTELMDGGSLQDRLRQEGRLSIPDAVEIISQIGSALEEAHSHNIVHRDLKPSNVLMSSNGRAVLADFGIAKIINSRDEANLTMAGTSLGTPEYMSPEQAVGNKIDRRSDIYSLGVVLYKLLTGQFPFQRESPLATLIAHSRDFPPPPRQHNPEIPPEIEAVIMRCLEKDPARRYQTAAEMVNALQRAAGLPGGIAPQIMPPLNPIPLHDITPDPVPFKSEVEEERQNFELLDPQIEGFEPPTAVNAYRHPSAPVPIPPGTEYGSFSPPNEDQAPTRFDPLYRRPSAPVPPQAEADYGTFQPDPANRQPPNQNDPGPRNPQYIEPVYSATSVADQSPVQVRERRRKRPGWLLPLILGVLVLLLLGVGLTFVLNFFNNASDKETTGNGGTTTAPVAGGSQPGILIFGMVENDKWDVYSANPDGSNQKKLTTGSADNLSPALSPDGKTLLYVAARAGGRWQIRRLELDSGKDIALTAGDSLDQYPSWSPDSKQIAFSSNRETSGNSAHLYIMNSDGNSVHRLNDDNAGYSSWSPSNFIAYSYYTGSFHALRRVDPNSKASLDLTASGDPAEYDLPVWSPDGKHLLAVRGAGAERAIYVLDANGGGFKRLSPAGETATNPAWSPDSKKVTYLTRVGQDANGRDRWELAQINVDGSQRRQLTSDGRQKFYLIWKSS